MRVPVDGVREQVGGDVGVAERLGKRAALIDDAAAGDVAAAVALVRDVLEVAVGVRIVQRAVLGEAFDVVAALHLVQADALAVVGAGDGVAVAIEIESPGVAAPFGEQLEASWSRG